ncbi:MAG: TetR/AcrR family transcriptional regulator [Candidatus Nanopelagicales bacterium]|nr:TetR/AcrR family transcriptional regulator [Candidatus Nanopelagicales bacterium]
MAEPDSTSSILGAVRAVLGVRGYANTTIKTVVAAADVAPGVVRSLYANKEQLLSAALRVPFDPSGSIPKLIAPGLDKMGERLVRLTLQLSGDEQVRKDATNLLQAARESAGVEQLRGLTDFLQATFLDRVVEAMGVPDARMRGALITAYLAGVAATRSMLNIEPLASATDEVIVALVAPTIQRLLDPTQPLPTKDAAGKS